MRRAFFAFPLSLTLFACGSVESSGSHADASRDAVGADHPDASRDSGTVHDSGIVSDADAHAAVACVDAVDGVACDGTAPPCSQPDNVCSAGYIWACSPSMSVWYKELVTCYTDTTSTTTTTDGCSAGQVLFVDDAAGDPCGPLEGTGSGSGGTPGGTCGDGGYLFEPGCCYYATNAYCVPAPAACSGGLSCACVSSLCDTQCGGGGEDFGISCASAVGSVVDCLCGKV